MQIISSIKKLQDVAETSGRLVLYGAGALTVSLLDMLREQQLPIVVSCIVVTDLAGNPPLLSGIPILALEDMTWQENDSVILSVSAFYYEEIMRQLETVRQKICVYGLDYDIVDEIPYQKVYSCFQDFIHSYTFPNPQVDTEHSEKYAWTCWWQGEENAPELVKECMASQKRKLPDDVKYIVITKDNYQDYVQIPEYMLDKVQDGTMMLAHLSDYIRCSLLYHWGGIWMDAAVYLLRPIPEQYFTYPLFTRRVKGRNFCSKAQWTISFLCAWKGNQLFHFVAEAYRYYFRHYDNVLYYLMTDYLIAIACNSFPDIEKQFLQIPYNNAMAYELRKHMNEPYDEKQYEKYIGDSVVQMLDRRVKCNDQNSIYVHLLKESEQ